MKKSKKIIEVENNYNMDFRDFLILRYHKEKKSIKCISEEIGFDKGNLSRIFKKLEIPTRSHSEAYNNWWNTISEDEKEKYLSDLSERSKYGICSDKSREKQRKTMQTREYKMKISKANSGKNNGMYKEKLTEEHRVETRGIFGYKKWSKEVRERDNYTCQICGENNRRMVAHHLESYDTNEELRLDLNNGITLCQSCHNEFHNRYKNQKTNTKQFIKFKEEKQRS
jgi:hypothetical protein